MIVPVIYHSLPLAFWVWAVHMLVFHVLGLIFEWCDETAALKRFKVRNMDRLSYAHLMRRAVVNQTFILLPAMLVCQSLRLAFVGPAHLPPVLFFGGLVLMGLGHDVVQYVTHRFLLHHRKLGWLGHGLHHVTGASKAISALYMSSADFFLNIVCPYLVPLILIGGGGSDVLFHVLIMGLGVVGGLYEHSGYDFSARTDSNRSIQRLLPPALISSHAHGQHHRRSSVSFSDGFGSPGLCDRLFGTSWYQH